MSPLGESFRMRDLGVALRAAAAALGLLGALVAAPVAHAAGEELTSARLLIAGSRLTVSPESQTVPFDTPTIVETTLEGFNPTLGTLPADLLVQADFTGPEINGVLTLQTVPNEPFRIPRLSLKGEYVLDNIRLVQGEELIAYAEPRSAAVLVTQILITKVTSRALTLDEIRNYGIVIDEDNFQAFNFTFGFAIEGEIVDYNVPVVFAPLGEGGFEFVDILVPAKPSRFNPPQLKPFVLDRVSQPSSPPVGGGCLDDFGGCRAKEPPPIPGAIIFPTDLGLLNQFFSVVLMVQNGAPEGDRLVVRDLTAKISIPPGLREAETEPPTPLGVPVPVRVPGPDGRLGTSDDITFLVAQATGEAEWLVEGLREGTHIVDIDIEGVLDGLPGEDVQRVEGHARGAVIVRDPTFGITISHPDVVRKDEEYALRLTVANTSNAPANLVTIKLPASKLIGAELADPEDFQQTIESLLPGESESVEFRMRSLLTGRVVATSARSPSNITPTFELFVGVGENDIPLSPASIVLPTSTEVLPDEMVRQALNLVGLGFSIATAPSSLLSSDLPRVSRGEVDTKVFNLAQAGRHVTLGEDLFDSVAVLAAEWNGARDEAFSWDTLRRTTEKGSFFAATVAQVLAEEAALTGAEAALDRFVRTTAFLPKMGAAMAAGADARVEVASRTSGKRLAFGDLERPGARELPFAELYDLASAEMAMMAVAEEGGYRVTIDRTTAGLADLHVLLTLPGPELRMLRWRDLDLAPGGMGVVEVSADDPTPLLLLDEDGDGAVDQQIPPLVEILTPRPFEAIAAVQEAEVDPSGHVIEVLFTGDVDMQALAERDANRFQIPSKVSNGGLIPGERGLFQGLRSLRVVRVVFNNPISPYIEQDMTVDNVSSQRGEVVVGQVLPVVTTVTDPGTLVEGQVIGPDGAPLPFAEVQLFQVDLNTQTLKCVTHKTAALRADENGEFLFDYVRQTKCSNIFTMKGFDPFSAKSGKATGRVRFIGETVRLDIVMLGRGNIRGRITYEDGSIPDPERLRLIGLNPVFQEGRVGIVDENGNYEIGDLPVGTISLSARDEEGNFVQATVAIPASGSVVEKDLEIFRRPPEDPTAELKGTVFQPDGETPVDNAWVALYIRGFLLSVTRSDDDGRFDFGTVPAELAEIESFDPDSRRSGAQIFFEIVPDQVNEVDILLRDARGSVQGRVLRRTALGLEPIAGAIVFAHGTPFNTTTAVDGTYRLDDVFAGRTTIVGYDPQSDRQVSRSVTLTEDAVVDVDLVIPIEGTGTIVGEVLGYDGIPVAGATVHIRTGLYSWIGEAFTDEGNDPRHHQGTQPLRRPHPGEVDHPLQHDQGPVWSGGAGPGQPRPGDRRRRQLRDSRRRSGWRLQRDGVQRLPRQ